MTRLVDAFVVLQERQIDDWSVTLSCNIAGEGTMPYGTFAATAKKDAERHTWYARTLEEAARNIEQFVAGYAPLAPADDADDDVEDAEVVTYTLVGVGDFQDVIESRTRVATRDGGSEWWRLRRKTRSAQARPLSDWDYEELLITGTSVTSEAAAIHWVVEGRLR
jgi:hypothetical protein